MESFRGLLYESFLRIHGWLLGVLALTLSIVVFFVGPDTKILIGWLVASWAVLLIALAVLADSALSAWRLSRRGLPQVRSSLKPPQIYEGIKRILLTDPSDLFGVDGLVSVYVKEDHYERHIGIGRVLTVQTNGYLQIGITAVTDSDSQLVEKLNGNDASFLGKLLVKPSVPSFLMQEK